MARRSIRRPPRVYLVFCATCGEQAKREDTLDQAVIGFQYGPSADHEFTYDAAAEAAREHQENHPSHRIEVVCYEKGQTVVGPWHRPEKK